jgi:hypothetical protein
LKNTFEFGGTMNNIHEKDWAEESWGGFSGMSNDSDWSSPEKIENGKPGKPADENETAPGK